MYNAVRDFLFRNAALFSASCWQDTRFEMLCSNISFLGKEVKQEDDSEKEAFEEKNTMKEKLCRGTADLLTLLQAKPSPLQFSSKNSEELYQSLLHKNDSQLREKFGTAQREATLKISELSRYGITAPVLMSFKDMADSFPPVPRNSKARAAQRQHIRVLCAIIDSDLERLDGKVQNLADRYANFAAAYLKKRKIKR